MAKISGEDVTVGLRNESSASTDSSQALSLDIKMVTQELLKFGLLEADRKPNLYRIAVLQAQQINKGLEVLDLKVCIDDIRGLVYVAIADAYDAGDMVVSAVTDVQDSPDEWSHPLVRRQRLTLEQSLLVAILRQHFLIQEQEYGIGANRAMIAVDELNTTLLLYLGTTGSDTRDDKRTRTLLGGLQTHGIVSEIGENDQLSIRPIITHLVNPESLGELLKVYRQLHDQSGAGQDS
jgi:hypothetical protein